VLHAAASLFRGAGYTAFDATPPDGAAPVAPPADPTQAALAAPYAHVTAPLRRLVDRFGLLVCLAVAEGRPVDAATRRALPTLPAVMASSGALAGRLDRAAVDTVEAGLLAPRVGEVFDATVISTSKDGGTIQLADPAVSAPCSGALEAGTRIRARLDRADIPTAEVRFSVVP
jgi:hypothetical protein